MSTRRLLLLSLLAVSLVAPLEAQGRRRSVRFVTTAPVVGGQCHTFGLVPAGLKASYLSTTPQGNVTFQITHVSDTPTRTHTTQSVQAPSGNAEAVTILEGEVLGAIRTLRHVNVKTTATVPVIGQVVTEVDINYVPSLAAGPVDGWCVGATWDTAASPSLQTVVTRPPFGPPTTITQNVSSAGVVLAVGDLRTAAGRVFNTVKYRSTSRVGAGAETSVTWVSMQYNIVVRQETLDAAGNVTSVTELTQL
ncbi:MAG TPA: hypothetical protein VGF28_21450 [Thermoanaerobaculia bacterium]|jgi:hypothetical protein